MTTETSNARGEDVEARQAWYEQQIALAETQWAADFLDMWECGDDVPSKEHYVALWLAERAAPPPAAARGDVRGLVAKWHAVAMDFTADTSLRVAYGTAAAELEAALAAEGVQAEPKAEARGVVDGVALIAAERQRQVEAEGWTPEHDDEHDDGALAQAAACYAFGPSELILDPRTDAPVAWPWEPDWWKPTDRIRDLTKAGALIAAEIDRLQRAALTESRNGR